MMITNGRKTSHITSDRLTCLRIALPPADWIPDDRVL
jgi:hypothetical protein